MTMRTVTHAARASLATAVAAALLALGAPALAGAANPNPPRIVNPGDPGSSQYQEDVPSAFGNVPASRVSAGRGHSRGATLPHGVATKLARAGATGRATAALALAGTPLGGTVTTSGSHTRSHSSAPVGGAGTTGGGTTGGGSGGSTGGSGGGSSASGNANAVAQAGAGRGVVASLARSLTGGDGGAGLLLPLVLALSVMFGVGAVTRRRYGDR